MRIRPEEIAGNAIERIGKQWMLVATEKEGKINAMTASWGGLGVLWGKPAAFVFVRPQRYTFELIENSALFTLNFLPESFREAYNLCGSKSGRDMDKLEASGLTSSSFEGAPAIEQAELTICCRKLYGQLLDRDAFEDKEIIPQMYPGGDFHKVYVGEIIAVESRQNP